ncbi:MAG: COP23 domain-containing protein [Nostoc sp.]|uniref:COP23 domain-containing protein n=1 Tax=Nostoc sp. TaxID=1180 RepID=UPI002FFBC819
MKLALLTHVLVGGAIALAATATINQPSQAESRPGFYCDTSGNKPVTVYTNSRGVPEPWIRWTSNYFRDAGYNKLTRCQDVSHRLETYRRDRDLKFITVGKMNGQNVVCTANQVNGRCERLILTLKPSEDGVQALNNILAWRQAGAPPLSKSNRMPYVDLRAHLGIPKE